MAGEGTIFWRQLDALREAAQAGDRATAARLLGDLARFRRTGEEGADRARAAMLERLAKEFGLDPVAAPSVPAPPPLTPARLPGIAAAGLDAISLVTCCRDREANLIRALASWLACPEIAEIVVVDWSSKTPVRAALTDAGIADARIRVVRVENEPRWVLSWAFNLGFRVATGDRILKADADILLAPDFFAKNPLEPGTFIAGNWRTAGADQAHVNGFVYLHRADLAAVAGYNDYITTYGWDDDDFYDRLTRQGTARRDVAAGTIRHLPHSDAERLGQGEQSNRSAAGELAADPMLTIRQNRLLAHLLPVWDVHKTPMPFEVTRGGSGDIAVVRMPTLPHPVPAQMLRDTAHYARLELTSWRLGQRVLELDAARLDLLLARPFAELTRVDVDIAASAVPETLSAPGGYLLLRAGAGGIGGIDGGAGAFDRLSALARARGMALAIAAPGPGLPPTDPEAARACAFVPDRPRDRLPPISPAALASAAQGYLAREMAWTPATLAALQAAPAIARPRGRLFADGQHGLGNRLRAIASAAVIAEKTGRELVVVWQADAHCDCRLGDLFDYKGAVLDEAFPDRARSLGYRLCTYMELEEGSAKDAPIDASGDSDLYLRSAYVLNSPLTSWEAENRWLRALEPVAEVRDLVARVRQPNDLSAHVRMAGGAAYEHLPYESAQGNWSAEGHAAIAHWRAKSHYSHFLARIDALAEQGLADRLFLAADAPETYAAFADRYGDRLAMLDRAVYDRSAAQLRHALADALLLGRAPRLLGSTWSSFSELALRLAPQDMTVEMSGKDF